MTFKKTYKALIVLSFIITIVLTSCLSQHEANTNTSITEAEIKIAKENGWFLPSMELIWEELERRGIGEDG